MTRGPRCTPRTQAALGLALCVLLAWPPLRHALEASMWRHMVLQFPLLMAAGLGLAFCVLAFVGIIIVVVRALMFGDPTSGWPSLVCIILLCSGVQLLCTGIAGEYLAKTYLETKHRPIYIAAETEEDLDAE